MSDGFFHIVKDRTGAIHARKRNTKLAEVQAANGPDGAQKKRKVYPLLLLGQDAQCTTASNFIAAPNAAKSRARCCRPVGRACRPVGPPRRARFPAAGPTAPAHHHPLPGGIIPGPGGYPFIGLRKGKAFLDS